MTQSGKSKGGRLRVLKNPQTDNDAAPNESTTAAKAGRIETCPRCFGTGLEIVPGEGARRCDCQTSDQLRRLFQSARIPARYQHCTLANFDAGTAEAMWIAKREAQIVLDDFLVIDGRGLLLVGPWRIHLHVIASTGEERVAMTAPRERQALAAATAAEEEEEVGA